MQQTKKGGVFYGANWKQLDSVELMAWLGLHLRSGVDKDGFRPFHESFSTKLGSPIYRACMSRNRFKEIKMSIR